MEGRLGITWGLSSIHGWGVFGVNLVRVLMLGEKAGMPRPLLLNTTPLDVIDPAMHAVLAPLIAEHQRMIDGSAGMKQVGLRDTLVLHSSGNGLAHGPTSARYRGARNFGFTFFEETTIPDRALAAAKSLDGMRTGSIWNRDFLIAHGVPDVVCVHQGVDTHTFQPRPKSRRLEGRFVIFSGGKLEYRKGQDLTVAAFKRFHARHPDALLLTVWQNPWPESIATLSRSAHINGLPGDGPAETALPAWTAAEGIPAGAHIDAGAIRNADLPALLSEADAALFPNRCEGGTNLAAMECMASGLPCVISMNTGHLDIASPDNAYPLTRQTAIPGAATQGWGDSDIDEIVERLEEIYTDRARAAARGAAARTSMQAMHWDGQIEKLVASFGA